MPNAQPFAPLGISVAVTAGNGATSASTALPGAGGFTCKVTNTIAFPVSVVFSNTSGGAVATATNEIVPANAERMVSIPYNTIDVAAYGIGGTGTVYFQRGDGGV
jgi:hypothetical protein